MDLTVLTLTIIVICIILLVNLLVYGAKIRSEAVLKKFNDELKNSGEHVLIKDTASTFFGLKSLGGGQIRNKGILALTDKRVYFARYFPDKVISITLDSINHVTTTDGYLGKNISTKLLKIGFSNDEVAFYIDNLSMWIEEINKAKQ